jgi:hypothetical protein
MATGELLCMDSSCLLMLIERTLLLLATAQLLHQLKNLSTAPPPAS